MKNTLNIRCTPVPGLRRDSKAGIVMELGSSGKKYSYPDIALQIRKASLAIAYKLSRDFTETFLQPVRFHGIDMLEVVQPMLYYHCRDVVLDCLILDHVVRKHAIDEIVIARDVAFEFTYSAVRYQKCSPGIRMRLETKVSFLFRYEIWRVSQALEALAHYLKTMGGRLLVTKGRRRQSAEADLLFCSFGYGNWFRALRDSILDAAKDNNVTIVSALPGRSYAPLNEEKVVAAQEPNVSLTMKEAYVALGDALYWLETLHTRLQKKATYDGGIAACLDERVNQVCRRYIPLAKLHIACMERLLQNKKPQACIVGEDAGYMNRGTVALCRRKEIPSFSIQHGVMQDVFGYIPCTDYFVASSEAEKEKLSEHEAFFTAKIVACASPELPRQRDGGGPRNGVVLVSTRLADWEFIHVRKSIECLLQWLGPDKLVIKLHPLEKTNHYKGITAHARIVQKEDLTSLLRQSRLALFLDISTAMADASAAGCPVAILESPLMPQLRENPIPCVAGKADIERLLLMDSETRTALLEKQHFVLSKLFGSWRGSRWGIMKMVFGGAERHRETMFHPEEAATDP